ncbi:MAG: phytanoyl-CoA dioxygenase family protein [Rhodobacteraceae bacterium]|nr:phytanoyl-CoA dioxygenase family protein [Paracoccaceae bacterium]
MSYSDQIWLGQDAAAFERFKEEVGRVTNPADWPLASEIAQNVPIYEATAIARADRKEVMAEWATLFLSGPGVLVIKGALPADVVDEATEVFDRIIAAEKASGAGAGDHFAKPGANDRVWNALEKHCIAAPENFVRYYAADGLAMASEAWLGRGYQMTAQVNRVNPGGAAQVPHRDYHLGFMTAEDAARFPAHVHGLSPLLTLQGAVAHADMPVETGPTMLLPYSQSHFEGYMNYRRHDYQAYFADHYVQMPLEKGDAVFFNPALMHGAGSNLTKNLQRMANLIQVGSAFGRSIEAVNRSRMVKTIYPLLGGMEGAARANVIASSAEGYAYPTNLDTDLPVGGLAPLTQAQILENALADGVSPADFNALIDAADARRAP